MKVVFLMCLGLIVGCKSISPPRSSKPVRTHSMLNLNDDMDIREEQKTWTPKDRMGFMSNRAFSAFDYWQVHEKEEVEKVWSMMSALLLMLGHESTLPQLQKSISSTLVLLEPTPEIEGQLDYIFFVSKLNREEGVIVRWGKRLLSGAIPSVSIILTRHENSKSSDFEKAELWMDPGFSELPTFRMVLKKQKSWTYQTWKEKDPIFSGEGDHIVGVLKGVIWKTVTGASYVGHSKSKMDSTDIFQRGFSKNLDMREIDLVYRQTSFPPRFDFTPKIAK